MRERMQLGLRLCCNSVHSRSLLCQWRRIVTGKKYCQMHLHWTRSSRRGITRKLCAYIAFVCWLVTSESLDRFRKYFEQSWQMKKDMQKSSLDMPPSKQLQKWQHTMKQASAPLDWKFDGITRLNEKDFEMQLSDFQKQIRSAPDMLIEDAAQLYQRMNPKLMLADLRKGFQREMLIFMLE